MRTIPFAALVVFGLASVSSVAFGGCTSVLGDFEVSSETATGDAGGGDGGEACTICNGQCVDLKTNTLNCGACGIACLGGQVCSESKCACAPDKAFCAGTCTPADRKHCGSSCQECQADEICTGSCQIAPPPSFDVTPRDPTGWVDESGNKLSFKIHDVGPGTKYECRSGPVGSFTSPTAPPWKACDGATGTGLVHQPAEDATVPEGSYRTEMRYRNDTFLSEPVRFDYYVHHRLDRVPTCPRAGKDEGPRFKDDEYFAAAIAFAGTPEGSTFDVNSQFPPAPATEVRNPFIKVTFTRVLVPLHITRNPGGAGNASMIPPWPTTNNQNWVFEDQSLRHKYVLNPTRTLMLVRRQYQSRDTKYGNSCANQYEIGNKLAAKTAPLGVVRGRERIDCEALVLDAHGVGMCMVKGPMGPQPLLLDESPDAGSYEYPPAMLSATGVQNSTTLTFSGNWPYQKGTYIEIPLAPGKPGRWYRITAATGNTVTLDQPLDRPVPAGSKFRLGNSGPQKRFLMPTGYAKLYEGNRHVLAPGSTTKCTTLGCNQGQFRQFLTYLPP